MTGPADDVRFRRREDVLERRVVDGLLVVPAGGGEPAHLTSTAAALWELLADEPTRDALAADLRTIFGHDARLDHDLGRLLDELRELRLVELR